MRIIYTCLFYLALPFAILRLFWKARKNPGYKERWHERLGYFTTPKLDKSIWVHAVSLGESIAAVPLIKSIKKRYPEANIVVTNTTPTGAQRIRQVFSNKEVYQVFFPYDYPQAIKRFLSHFKPQLLVIMETELWPNVLYYCRQSNIPILIANARLSLHSYKNYQKIGKFTKAMLNNITTIAAQSIVDQERYLALGAKQVILAGNIKFDLTIPGELITKAARLHALWGRTAWIAASTHPGEDQQILAAHKKIKEVIPDALLILVPRHPERFTEVTKLSKEQFNTISYKRQEPCAADTEVIIGDTVGELLLLYAVSGITFVGGSLVPNGGHNLLEPAALGLPVISGEFTFNFVEITRLLLEAGSLTIVKNADELAETVIRLWQNDTLRKQQGEAGKLVVEQNKGALAKLVHWIEERMEKSCA